MLAEVQGVARVNGTLAVSRAFGDAEHKKTGGLHHFAHGLVQQCCWVVLQTTAGPSPMDYPVTCAPELNAECLALAVAGTLVS